MANSAQAIKRVRQNDSVRARQKGQVTAVRTAVKNTLTALEENAENSTEL